jgi:membrane-associated protease RseP (regulator of RpoE activity)
MGDKQTTATIFVVVIMLLTLPLRWLGAALIAAAIHEAGHYLSVRFLGGTVHSIKVGPAGAVMSVSGLTEGSELICLLTGPAAGFMTMLFINRFPLIALCAAIQSIYNLLPVYPLDGGRAMRLIVQMLGGTDKHIRNIEYTVIAILFFLCVLIRVHFGISLFLFIIILLFRKTPCKHY